MAGPIVRWLHRHDPEWYALQKAVKVSIAVTIGLAIGTATGNGQMSLFASFGGVALLLFADFPGGRGARFGAYIGLVVVGAVLITVGTLASGTAWLAVTGMAVVGFLVLFAGVLSSAFASATRAVLLAFILPVTVLGTAADIPSRLAGWGISAVLAIPLAILVWPPRDHDKLRARAADACAALARQLHAPASPTSDPPAGATDHPPDRLAASHAAILALRQQFRSSTCRPVGLTTGSRVLMQLPDRLEWLRAVADRIPSRPAGWPPATADLLGGCAEVLQASADVLADPAHRPTYATRARLATALRSLDRHRAKISSFLQVVAAAPPDVRQAPADPDILRPAIAHELAYTVHLAGRVVSVSAAADARPLLDRLLGRQAPGAVDGPIAAALRIAAGHITRNSVWFQNSLRGALGLTIAVLLAEVTQIEHGFWVVLGAMSVLRTTALTTGSTALRALGGTFLGFVAGAVIMTAVGTTPWQLWALLPFAVLIAAYLPEAVSFAAGQAAFTLMVIILFNIIQPTGWSVGLVRIEDIALGCAAGLISGVLLWPRGASAQIRTALADYYRRSADALEAATERLIHPDPAARTLDDVLSNARAAGFRLDDALREYLFERGTKSVPIAELTAVSNGASRVRLAAEAIVGMLRPSPLAMPTLLLDQALPAAAPAEPGTDSTPATSSPPAPVIDPLAPATQPPLSPAMETAGSAVSGSAVAAATWFRELADGLAPTKGERPALPAVLPVRAEELVLDTFRRHPGSLIGHARAAQGRTMWSASLYVDDVTRLQTRLTASATVLNRPGHAGTPAEIGPDTADGGEQSTSSVHAGSAT